MTEKDPFFEDQPDGGVDPGGFFEGEQEAGSTSTYVERGNALTRTLDYDRAALGGPLLDQLAGQISGKGAQFSGQWAAAATPFSGQGFPNSEEILAAHGVPEISAGVVPANNEWWSPDLYVSGPPHGPEKVTVRGLLGRALDLGTAPSSWLGLFGKAPAEAVSKGLAGKAEDAAFSAVRPYKGYADYRNFKNRQLGRAALDARALRGFFPTSEKIMDRLAERKAALGAAKDAKVAEISARTPEAVRKYDIRNGYYDESGYLPVPQAGAAGPVGIPPKFGVSKKSLVSGAMAEREARSGFLSPKERASFKRTMDDQLAEFPDFMNIQQSETLKTKLDQKVSSAWKKIKSGRSVELTDKERDLMSLADAARQGSEDAASFVASELDPKLFSEFKDLKDQYGPTARAESAARDRFRGDITNNKLSLTDGLAAGFGVTTAAAMGEKGLPLVIAGLGAAGARQYARKFGMAQLAKGLDLASQMPLAALHGVRALPLTRMTTGLSPWSLSPNLSFEGAQ